MFSNSLNTYLHSLKSLSVKEKAFLSLLLGHFLLLLFFGKTYTKAELYTNIYFHDIFFGMLFIFSFTFKFVNRIKAIEGLILFSVAYLIVSMAFKYNEDGLWYIYLRQFMLFGYMILSYFIFKAATGIKMGFKHLLQIIVLIAVLSVFAQIIYVLYLYSKTGILPFFERRYFTPLTVIGVIAMGAYSLVYLKKLQRQIAFILVFILSFTFGHDSAYLSLIIIYFIYYFIKIPLSLKILMVVLLIFSIVCLFLFVNTFTDVNMYTRIILWGDTFKSMIANGSIFYGNGFGIPYLEESTIEQRNNLVINNQPASLIPDEPLSKYIATPHNSFISMIIHLGILSVVLLILPLKKIFTTKILQKNPDYLFLILALVGASVWSFFNVILELPHSSSYFWLIYFTLAFSLSQNIQTDTKENA